MLKISTNFKSSLLSTFNWALINHTSIANEDAFISFRDEMVSCELVHLDEHRSLFPEACAPRIAEIMHGDKTKDITDLFIF